MCNGNDQLGLLQISRPAKKQHEKAGNTELNAERVGTFNMCSFIWDDLGISIKIPLIAVFLGWPTSYCRIQKMFHMLADGFQVETCSASDDQKVQYIESELVGLSNWASAEDVNEAMELVTGAVTSRCILDGNPI